MLSPVWGRWYLPPEVKKDEPMIYKYNVCVCECVCACSNIYVCVHTKSKYIIYYYK